MLSWDLDVQIFAIVALLMGDVAGFWASNNPSLFTTRTFRSKHGVQAEWSRDDIRLGGALAAALTIVVALGGAVVAGKREGGRFRPNGWVLVGAFFVLLYEWAIYEWAIANPHEGGPTSIADQPEAA